MKDAKVVSILLLIILLVGCQTNKEERSSKVLDNFKPNSDYSFTFEKTPWFTSKEELLKIKELDDKDIELLHNNNTIKLKENYTFKEPQVDAIVLYNFQDNKLCSGEYDLLIDNKEKFIEVCQQLNKVLEKDFPKPITETGLLSGDNKVIWQGEDNCYLYIDCITNENNTYIIHIQVTSPKNKLEFNKCILLDKK